VISTPKTEGRAEQPYMGIRTQVAVRELGSGVIPQLHSEVMAWMKQQGMEPSGAPFIRYHCINMAEKLDVELGWPVKVAVAGNGRVRGGALPAGQYASVLYTGPYDGLMNANRVLIDWAKDAGIVWDSRPSEHGDEFGGRFETYITDPGDEPDPAKWETEVAIRIADV
jgi:effector-binding domain-containing protein